MELARVAVMFIALVCYLTAYGFGIVSTTTSEWYVDQTNTTAGGIVRRGLWIQCDFDGVCRDIAVGDVDVLRTTRGFSIMALIVASVAFFTCLAGINEGGKQWKLISFLLLLITAVFQLVAVGVYTDEQRGDLPNFNMDNWGYSFEMAWAAVFLYAVASLLYLIVATLLQDTKAKVRYSHF